MTFDALILFPIASACVCTLVCQLRKSGLTRELSGWRHMLPTVTVWVQSESHRVEGEKQVPQVGFWVPHVSTHIHMWKEQLEIYETLSKSVLSVPFPLFLFYLTEPNIWYLILIKLILFASRYMLTKALLSALSFLESSKHPNPLRERC